MFKSRTIPAPAAQKKKDNGVVVSSENASPAGTEGSRHETFKLAQRDPSSSLGMTET
jgi:hypothetical protein